MLNRLYPTILMTACILALGSCVIEERIDPVPESTHVLLAYIGTDNNLSGYEQEKIQALRNGWMGNPNDHIIVYRDNRSSNARLMEVSNLAPGEQPREIAAYGDENSASPPTLNRVITDVLGMYPSADNYGLLVFSHASGWLTPETLYNPYSYLIPPSSNLSRSVITDDTHEMDITGFTEAIPDGVFNYIVFETYFMAGVEVAYELRNKAPLILASSAKIVDPGFAPVCPLATGRLFSADLSAFGQNAFNHMLTYADSNPQRSATYSVIRTAGLEALADFIWFNCDLSREVDITDIQHFDRLNGYRLFFDFGDYYGRLLNTDAQRAELSRLIADCIVWKAATESFMTQNANYNGFAISKHSGLTCYIPQEHFEGLNDAYYGLEWAKGITRKTY